jgi:hypothetical protein
MKKSFTLKAFAFGVATTVALSASATPHQFLVDNSNNLNQALPLELSKTAKPMLEGLDNAKVQVPVKLATQKEATSEKAPAKKADANYGEWAEGGQATYSYTLWYSDKVDQDYQIREDSANEGACQFKFNYGEGVYTTDGVETTITVTANEDGTYAASFPREGVKLNKQGYVSDPNTTYDLYVYDIVSWYKNLEEKGYNVSSYVTAYADYCTYDPEQGLASMYCVVSPSINNTATVDYNGSTYEVFTLTWNDDIETFRRLGGDFKNYEVTLGSEEAYFSHAKDATTGTYNIETQINDCSWIAFRMVNKDITKSVSTYINTLYNELAAGTVADDVCLLSSDGLAQVPVTSYRKGTYTLIYLYAAGSSAYYGYAVLSATKDDVNFYDAGTASFTDASMFDALPPVFGYTYYDQLQSYFAQYGYELPDEYTVSVPCQANSKNEGEYRLVHPFAQYFNNYLSNFFYYDPTCDYLTFNVSDPAESYIAPSTNGIYFPADTDGDGTSDTYIMFAFGSTNQMDGGSEASEDAWGTFADGVLSFDEIVSPETPQTQDEITSALSYTQATYDADSTEATLPAWAAIIWDPQLMKIETSIAGIKNVIADTNDANAPVEYFNLQGMRVANPAAGQLLIQRQGSKATKVVIR